MTGMLEPLARLPRGFTASTARVPPPVGGWNARDFLDTMDERDAITLDNWFPRERDVVQRLPNEEHADTGETTSIVGLSEHNVGPTSKLLAFTNGKVFDVTTSTVPAALTTGLDTAAEVFSFNYLTKSFHMNGADAIQEYDGTTWATNGFTTHASSSETFTSANVIAGMGFHNRVYFIDDNFLGFFYSDTVDVITGADMMFFPLASILQKGGTIVACGSLTDDTGGGGRDDYACFISSKGQVAIYSGTDPGDAANWSLSGIYDIGEPVNRFGVIKYGADLIFVTRDGYVTMSSVLSTNTETSKRFTLSDKIQDAANDAVTRYKANKRWRLLLHPGSSMLIVNIPRSGTQSDQHVMNTVTGAWCRFRDMNATSWSLLNGEAYFGGFDGKIQKMESTTFSATTAVTSTAVAAWNYFKTPGRVKQFTQCQPIFETDSTPFVQIGFANDFGAHETTGGITAASISGIGVWDTAIWDVAIWSGISAAVKQWVGIGGTGYAGSLRVISSESQSEISWKSTRLMFKVGGPR